MYYNVKNEDSFLISADCQYCMVL